DERDDEDPGDHPRAAAHGAQMGWRWRSGVRARPRRCRGCTRRLALAPAHAFTLALAPAHALAHVFAPALALAPAPTRSRGRVLPKRSTGFARGLLAGGLQEPIEARRRRLGRVEVEG